LSMNSSRSASGCRSDCLPLTCTMGELEHNLEHSRALGCGPWLIGHLEDGAFSLRERQAQNVPDVGLQRGQRRGSRRVGGYLGAAQDGIFAVWQSPSQQVPDRNLQEGSSATAAGVRLAPWWLARWQLDLQPAPLVRLEMCARVVHAPFRMGYVRLL
jgi:hypothetical protein